MGRSDPLLIRTEEKVGNLKIEKGVGSPILDQNQTETTHKYK
jgi:hypothetical protein